MMSAMAYHRCPSRREESWRFVNSFNSLLAISQETLSSGIERDRRNIKARKKRFIDLQQFELLFQVHIIKTDPQHTEIVAVRIEWQHSQR